MNELNPSYGAAYISKVRDVSPHSVMKRIMDENPKAKPSEIDKLFIDVVTNDPALNNACLQGFAVNVRMAIERLRSRPGSESGPAAHAVARQERDKRDTEVKDRAAKVVSHALLSFVSSLTVAQLERHVKSAPKFARILQMCKAKKAAADQLIGQVLTESAILKVLNGRS